MSITMKIRITYPEIDALIAIKVKNYDVHLSYFTRESCKVSITKDVLFSNITQSVICYLKITGDANINISYDGNLIITTAVTLGINKIQANPEMTDAINCDNMHNINIDLNKIKRLSKFVERISLKDIFFTTEGVIVEAQFKWS